MKAKRNDGKIVTLRIGEAICGYCFRWIKIELKDRQILCSKSKWERQMAAKWLDHLLTCRLSGTLKK